MQVFQDEADDEAEQRATERHGGGGGFPAGQEKQPQAGADPQQQGEDEAGCFPQIAQQNAIRSMDGSRRRVPTAWRGRSELAEKRCGHQQAEAGHHQPECVRCQHCLLYTSRCV